MRTRILLGFFLLGTLATFGQNAVVGSGFAPGWGGGSCPTGNSDFQYLGSSVGSSYIRTDNANGTGNQYFRMAVDWGGTTGQYTLNPGSDDQVTIASPMTLNTNCTTSGALYINVGSTSYNYVFKTEEAGSSPSMKLIVFEVQGDVRTVSSVSEPSSVYVGNDVTITATLSGSLSTGQTVWLEYTKDNWTTSSLGKMSGSGTTYTDTINDVTAAQYKYRVITSGDVSSITTADADWYAINENDNAGADYDFTATYGNVASGGSCSGVWSDGDCWINGSVPPSGVDISILEDMAIDQDATVEDLTVANTKTLSTSGTRELTIANNGSITLTGSLNAGTSLTVDFAGNGTVTGTADFYNVEINGGVNFGSSSNIKSGGSLTINAGGFVNTNAPSYNSSSTLIYNSGTTYGRSNEWGYIGTGTAGTDAGYPGNVTIRNSTTLNLKGTTSAARACSGTLTIENGSALTMDDMSSSFTVLGSVAINSGGTMTLSSVAGGDLLVLGSSMTNSGTFNNSGRQVTFQGTAAQTISGSFNTSSGTSNNFSYLEINNANNTAGVGVNLGDSVYVVNRVTLTDGILFLGNYNLTMGSSATFSGLPAWGVTTANYIAAEGEGRLKQTVSTSAVTYPIGTQDAFMPIRLSRSSGSSDFLINLTDTVGITDGSYCLFHIWDLAGSGTVDMDCQWPDSEEGSNFPSGNITIMKRTGGTWSDLSYTSARSGSDPYTAAFSGVSCCSQFVPGSNNALPVDLLYFKGQRIDEVIVQLSWATASEINNDYFEILRSEDGVEYTSVGLIDGKGNSSVINHYHLNDVTSEQSGTIYYQLRQVDYDGSESIYGPIAVLPNAEIKPNVTLYPMPVKGDLNVEINSDQIQTMDFVLTNSLGQTVAQGSNELTIGFNRLSIETDHLSRGIYYLRLGQGNQSNTYRVIVE